MKLLLNIQKFAEFNGNLKDLIKKFTNEAGEFDEMAANTSLNDNILKYNSKNQPKIDDFKIKAKEEVIKELGIESVTNENQLKAYLSNLTSTEQAQDLKDAIAKASDFETKYNDMTGKYTDANGKLIGLENGKFLLGKGVNPEYLDFLAHTIGQQVNEETDFSKAYENYAPTHQQYFNTEPEIKQPITTGKPRVVKQTEEMSGVKKLMIEKGLIKN